MDLASNNLQRLIWHKTQTNKQINMAAIFFSIIVSRHFWNDLYAFRINSSDILFHSSSIALFSEPIFGWEVAVVLFSKMIQSRGIMAWAWWRHNETNYFRIFFWLVFGVKQIIVSFLAHSYWAEFEWKKWLNNRVNHENLDLSFFSTIGRIRLKNIKKLRHILLPHPIYIYTCVCVCAEKIFLFQFNTPGISSFFHPSKNKIPLLVGLRTFCTRCKNITLSFLIALGLARLSCKWSFVSDLYV